MSPSDLLDVFLHLDQHLNQWITFLGPWTYLVLFLILFCETGLIVAPFLPGDSLLFTLGALSAADGSPLRLRTLAILLITAAILGDNVNYAIGRKVGPKIFRSETGRWLNKKHLVKTGEFYEKHGGKAVLFARFFPILRTFAPFVAGIGRMKYLRFLSFSVVGGMSWVSGFLLIGHFFGNLPAVKDNFQLVILGIIVVSLLPAVREFFIRKNSQS